jgi:hypothetical protein
MPLDCKPFTEEQTRAFIKIEEKKTEDESKKKSATGSKKKPGNVVEEEMAILGHQSGENNNNGNGEGSADTQQEPSSSTSKGNDNLIPDSEKENSMFSVLALPGWLITLSVFQFGAIHCVAWNWDVFPSSTEQYWWRVTSVLTTVMPILTIVLTQVNNFIAFLAYFAVRVYLVVEPFLSLRSQLVAVCQDVHCVRKTPIKV